MSSQKVIIFYGTCTEYEITKILFYNVQAFKDAGIEAPETMDEFINAAKKLAGTNATVNRYGDMMSLYLAGWNSARSFGVFGVVPLQMKMKSKHPGISIVSRL